MKIRDQFIQSCSSLFRPQIQLVDSFLYPMKAKTERQSESLVAVFKFQGHDRKALGIKQIAQKR